MGRGADSAPDLYHARQIALPLVLKRSLAIAQVVLLLHIPGGEEEAGITQYVCLPLHKSGI